jgi:hypothetical protein
MRRIRVIRVPMTRLSLHYFAYSTRTSSNQTLPGP